MADDYAGDSLTAGTISVGGSQSGTIEVFGDSDWFAIALIAGRTYRFDLQAESSGNGTWDDPFLALYDSGSVQIRSDDDSGTGLDSRITYTATATATYYLAPTDVYGFTGTYLLSATELDDYLGNTSTAGTVSIGGSQAGTIESSGDTDWFAVTLTAGYTYSFDLQGQDSGQGTLTNPSLQLHDSSGTSIISDDDGGTGFDSRITHQATSSGTYYLSAAAVGGITGTYLASAAVIDDYAYDGSTTGAVSIGGSQVGAIETGGDIDAFAVTLTAGRTYRFNLQGQDSLQGTLTDPSLQLFDSIGVSITSDNDSGTGLDSEITYTATASGTYYVSASASGGLTGTYLVSATEQPSEAVHNDFNGDGKSDIVWQQDNGTGAWTWEMDGTQVGGHGLVGYGGTGWHIADTGDFNGDGKSDLLWQQDNGTGIWIWEMDGTQVSDHGFVGSGGPGWCVVGTGDFNGDGKTDILWQQDSGTGVSIWEMDGTQVSGHGFVGYGGAGWHVAGTGDFDGDGKSDIVWQQDNGTGVWIGEMDGTQVSDHGFGGYGGPGWPVAGTGDFVGVGKADV
ncbi:MAG: FG-GAP-like repeat-containing protein, partial [Alphaproteobacteria bacterium]